MLQLVAKGLNLRKVLRPSCLTSIYETARCREQCIHLLQGSVMKNDNSF